jgi:hypothetical protein
MAGESGSFMTRFSRVRSTRYQSHKPAGVKIGALIVFAAG